MEKINNIELAKIIIQATVQELGRELLRGNIERSKIRKFFRNKHLIRLGEQGYEDRIQVEKCGMLEDAGNQE